MWPAEWTDHEATWLAWPHNRATWPSKFSVIPAAFAQLVRAVAAREPVRLLAAGNAAAEARKYLGELAERALVEIPTDDAWLRDSGPTFTWGTAGQLQAVDWNFSAWGGKYAIDHDRRVARRIADVAGVRHIRAACCLEGGAVEGNGQAMVITTESCLLNDNRNPGALRADVERCLAQRLGAETVIWLPGDGLAGDDTDGHIDQLARFVSADTVVVAVASDPRDPNREALKANHDHLSAWRLGDQRLQVVPLPIPRPRWCFARRLPCSYCNFYYVNGGLIVPVFDDDHRDDSALQLLGELHPDRRIIPLPAVDLAWGLGTVHCLTQQQPRRLDGFLTG